jgi:hypothetical protein
MTLFGEGGVGKTTLGAMFPSPVFIRTEDGTASLVGNDDVKLFPLATSSQDVLDAIQALAEEEHAYQTLVIDSITQLGAMIEHEIVAQDGSKSINQAAGGYGAGYSAAAERHRMIREWAGALAYEKNMSVVFIGHADTETLDLPDMDAYSRYTIRLHKKSVASYVDNVDLVGFIRLKTILRNDAPSAKKGSGQKKRAISTGEREIICFPTAANVSKNRFGITAPLEWDLDRGNPFESYLPK